MKRVLERYILLLLVAFGTLTVAVRLGLIKALHKTSRQTLQYGERTPAAVSSKLPNDPFPEGYDLFSKLDEPAQERLVAVVVHFCSKQYDQTSCVYYLTKCGRGCLAFLNSEEQLRVIGAYESARQKLGLPPLETEMQ